MNTTYCLETRNMPLLPHVWDNIPQTQSQTALCDMEPYGTMSNRSIHSQTNYCLDATLCLFLVTFWPLIPKLLAL